MTITHIKPNGYLVLYWDKAEDMYNPDLTYVLHDPTVSKKNYRISEGSIRQVSNGISECDFSVGMLHNLYDSLEPIRGIVKVINVFDGEEEFRGRILNVSKSMNSKGFIKKVNCEDMLAYLHDSVQDFEKVPNNGWKDYLTRIINRHNSQVEKHKQFKVGKVSVQSQTDTPFRYTGYDSSWNTIKERVIDKTNGYLVLRHEGNEMYIDFLAEVGDIVSGSPIMLGANIKEATRDLIFDDLLTRIVPVGADIDTNDDTSSGSTDIIRPQVTIKSVNGGANYLESKSLVEKFGLITKSVTWSNINDPNILKARGQQYLDGIKAILASWQVGVVERYFIDSNYVKFKVGNSHEIINAPMSGIEKLQIIEKNIDLLKPHAVTLTIGADNQSLSMFNLQQQEAQKSIEKLLLEKDIERKAADAKSRYDTEMALLMSELEQYKSLSSSYANEITDLASQIATLDSEKDSVLIASLTTQKTTATTNKNIYDQKVIDTQSKIDILKGGI